MLIVMPSDPTTLEASAYLKETGVPHEVIAIPEDLGYKTGANIALYFEGNTESSAMMVKLSAQGFVIMRVFREFTL